MTDRPTARRRRLRCSQVRTRISGCSGTLGIEEKGYAVRHGMLETRGEWVLFTDADLSAPIEELETLWSEIERGGYEVAIGSRSIRR